MFTSGDDHASAAKPQIDWEDSGARDALIDSRSRDAYGCLMVIDGTQLSVEVGEAAELLATVVGQDIELDSDGVFWIIRGTAGDRVISTVDVDARHGRKTTAHRFDGYKGHIAIDPDTEIITNTVVGAANPGDDAVAADLIAVLLGDTETETDHGAGDTDHHGAGDGSNSSDNSSGDGDSDGAGEGADRPKMHGDAAYGTGEFLDILTVNGIESGCKTQPPVGGRRLVFQRPFRHRSRRRHCHLPQRGDCHHPTGPQR